MGHNCCMIDLHRHVGDSRRRSGGPAGARTGQLAVLPLEGLQPLRRIRRNPGPRPHTERLAEAGIEPSVGSVGDSYDNALAETINGLYTTEVIHRRGPWRSFAAVEFATLEWVDWFNTHSILFIAKNFNENWRRSHIEN